MSGVADVRHQSLMDGIYARQRHIYDLTRRYYLLGRDPMIAALDIPTGGSVLEVGCGTGRNLVLAAKRYPTAHCYGFDISTAMLETANDEVAKAGLAGRITLAPGDATDFDTTALFDVPTFDRVFISYAVSMIPGWEATIPAALAAVKPGGTLHIVDFGDCSGLPGVFKAGLGKWLAAFHVAPRLTLEDEMRRAANTAQASLHFTRPKAGYVQYGVITKAS